jgi:hypothetical protein
VNGLTVETAVEAKAERREQVKGYPFLAVECPACKHEITHGLPLHKDDARPGPCVRRCSGCGRFVRFEIPA